MKRNKVLAYVGGIGAAAVVAVGGSLYWWQAHQAAERVAARGRLAYRAGGYGGFAAKAPVGPVSSSRPLPPTPPLPPKGEGGTRAVSRSGGAAARLDVATTAYARGDYKGAEAAARAVVVDSGTGDLPSSTTSASKGGARVDATPPVRSQRAVVASARHLMAFAAARRGDLKTARARFALARQDAERLPGEASPKTAAAVQSAAPGMAPVPTLAQDAAYQHAACTMGLGDRAGAERELVQFLRDFPESPLVHAAIGRIARLHGGDIPKSAEAVWQQAQVIQRKAQAERDRQGAMCAPECLAYLLGTTGEAPVESLAKEMRTGGDGTTLLALVGTAKRHGFGGARGVRLTEAGLRVQRLPLVALVSPGHFVVVTAADADKGVTAWDGGSPLPPPPPNPRRERGSPFAVVCGREHSPSPFGGRGGWGERAGEGTTTNPLFHLGAVATDVRRNW